MAAADTYDAPPRRGMSLAKGPVALIGLASLILGVLGFIFASTDFTTHPPSGTVNSSRVAPRAQGCCFRKLMTALP